MVERNIYFYDIETMDENSVCQNIMQVEKKLVNACYGMQVLNLGQPYTKESASHLTNLLGWILPFRHTAWYDQQGQEDRTEVPQS